MVIRFDSLSECASVVKGMHPFLYAMDGGENYGYLTHAKALQTCIEGDNSFVAPAEKLMDKLDASIEVSTASWQPSMNGAYPVVPEFLAGTPTCMRQRVHEETECAPIAIYVGVACSSAISAEQMRNRGTAILALLMKLQVIRPIELYIVEESGGKEDCFSVVRIESKPLNLSTAGFALCHVGFVRHVLYTVANNKVGFTGQWPMMYKSEGYEAYLRSELGMKDNDLFVKAAYIGDPLLKDPIAWVNAQVERFTKREE
jgi:hypothetical protein